ncbi:hypothetical protein [Mycobacterium avium]|uniref:hypothetical protein n=1 Tax=Mycobacterium avium TaxID=1764 RepID=UPI0018D01F8B|nr:hypothetical protein [Mycobacterium avium]
MPTSGRWSACGRMNASAHARATMPPTKITATAAIVATDLGLRPSRVGSDAGSSCVSAL